MVVAHWPNLVKIMFIVRLCFLVFCLTDLIQISLAARSSEVIMSAKAGETCDMKHDVLLVEDSSSENSYLQCLPAGRGLGGFWERVPCQPGQKFFFTEQKCDSNPHQKPQRNLSPTSSLLQTTPVELISSTSAFVESTLTSEETTTTTTASSSTVATSTIIIYAGMNQSCATGELCELGTVCDFITRLCSCPPGLINVPGTRLCDFAPMSTTFAPLPTTTIAETSSQTEPETTVKKYSIALELFTQQTPVYTQTTIPRLISPGSSCKDAEAQCSGGSYCNTDNYVCSCPTETVDESGICLHIKVSAGINERCDRHTKCTGWSTCIDKMCRCQAPLVQNGNQCLSVEEQQQNRESKPDQPCDKGQICVGGSVCSTITLLCVCPIGFHNIGDSCISLTASSPVNSSIGQRCNINANCISGAYCSATTNPPSCQCLSTHVFVNELCFKIVNPGQKGCDLDNQCSASYQGARCVMGTCICPNGMIAQSQTCRPVTLNPGDICRNNEACSGGATCFQKVCVCSLGFVAMNKKCVETSHTKTHHSLAIGQKCSNKNKQLCMAGSECKNGICQCLSDTILVNETCQEMTSNDTNEALIFPLDLGMFLVNFTQIESSPVVQNRCKSHDVESGCGSNEICNRGICECMDGFIRVNMVCRFKYVKVGETCTKDQKCLSGSDCFEGICTCWPGLKNHGGKCVASTSKFKIDCPVGTTLVGNHCQNMTQEDIAMDTFCTDMRQCGRGFVCINNKCVCPSGTNMKLGQCWRNPGGTCSNGEVCNGCSVCIRNLCTCSGNVAPVNGICPTNIARPNERCNTGQCCIGASECLQGICVCPEGTQFINHECTPSVVNSLPFEPCNKGQLCIGGSMCSNGICLCPVNQVVLANQCQDPPNVNPSPGEPCKMQTNRCTGGSTCNHGVCVCPPGQYPIEKMCIPNIPGIPGDPCSNIDPCVPGVICLFEKCQCPDQQMWSVDRCVGSSGQTEPGGLCSSPQQCIGGSICQNGRCTCNANQVVVNSQCKTRLVFPNEQCQHPQECTGNSQCLQGFCLCSSNSIPVDGICVLAFPHPGDSCNPAFSHCSGGSTCNVGVCVCPQGQEALNGVCGSDQITAQPGEFCDPAIYLCNGGALCINNKCACNADSFIINSECKPKRVQPNSECHPFQQCIGGSQCLEGNCLCQANFIASSKGICTSVQPAPGEVCDINFSVCRGGSVCIHSKCACQQDQSIVNEMCTSGPTLIPAKPNDFCDIRLYQCTGGSNCLNGRCICPANNIPVDNICQNANPLPFQFCKAPQVCSGGSSCIDGTCLCTSGKLTINKVCKDLPVAGEKCTSDVPICGGGATCLNTVCMCPKGNQPMKGKCNTAKVGQFCTEDSYYCLNDSRCSSENVCACPNDKILSDSKCIDVNPGPGSICFSPQTCSGGSVCIQNVCQCPNGFISGFNNKCVPFSGNPGPSERCTLSQTCTGGSICINGICQCANKVQAVAGICRGSTEIANPGQSCKNGQTCVGGSTCANGICICPPNQISKGNVCVITSGNNVAAGGMCTTNAQCGGGTTCVNKKCMCSVNSIVYSNMCISRQVDAGGSCILFVQTCLGGSRCLGSICVCPQNQVATSGVCKVRQSYFVNSFVLRDQKFSLPGEKCNLEQQCNGGSKCINKLCTCPHGFRKNQGKCLRISQQYKQPGSWCANDYQCTKNTICKNSACICPSNMSVVAGECTLLTSTKTHENGTCLTTSQCMDGLICLFGFCHCLNNTGCQGMGHFTSPPGGSCAALQRCSGGSVCRSGWCVCPEANMVVDNGLCLLPTNTTSQPDAEEAISDYEEESSATDDLSVSSVEIPQNPQPSNLQPVRGLGQTQINVPTGSSGFNSGSPPIGFGTGPPPLGFGSGFGFGSHSLGFGSGSPSFGFSSEAGSSSIGMGSIMTNANINSFPVGSKNVANQEISKPSSNFTAQSDKQYVRPGAACYPSTVCTGGSKCILGMCLCDDQFQIIGQICVRKVPPVRASPPMGSCQNGEPCTGGAICDGQICQCLPGTELRSNLCYPLQSSSSVTTRRPMMPIIVVPPMASCSNGERCGGSSVCNRVSFVCECPNDLQPMQGHCIRLINKNRTTIQNNPNLSTIPVASAWQNPPNAPYTGGRSEIYKPTIYSLMSNSETIESPKAGFSNPNVYGPFFPSIPNDGIDKPNVNLQLNGFPAAPENMLSKVDVNPEALYNTGILKLPATGSVPLTDASVSNTYLVGTNSGLNEPETSTTIDIPAPPNGQCGRGRLCTGGSFCVHLRCRCPEGTAANEFDVCQRDKSSNNVEIAGIRLGGICTEEKTCAGASLCISGRCRCPPNTMQDGPVCISLKDSGKQRFFSAPIMHADATTLCPHGAEPIKENGSENYIQCNASRPNRCPWGWYCYATDKALEEGPYYCCPA